MARVTVFTAQYHGPCANCDGDVKGTQVAYNAHDRLEHVECPDPIPAITKACPRCFIELPVTGVCGVCE